MTAAPFLPLPLSKEDQRTLLEMAREHIQMYLATQRNIRIEESRFSKPLQQITGNYVRLILDNKTRGAVGNLPGRQPLVADINQNAYDAAFEDPRFPPVTREEIRQIIIEITVLTHPQIIVVDNEQQLLDSIHPGEEGLLLSEGVHQSHLMPSDWRRFPDPATFVGELKRKAGLPQDYWSDTLHISRFDTISFRE